MFNTTQKVQTKTVDERILPENGIICLWKIARYVGKDWVNNYVEDLVINFEANKIPILKVSKEPNFWLVNLEDIKALQI